MDDVDVSGGSIEMIMVAELDMPGFHDLNRRVYSVEGICPTIPTGNTNIPKVMIRTQ